MLSDVVSLEEKNKQLKLKVKDAGLIYVAVPVVCNNILDV